uniref:Uncharacterized protein n=1 Tax=Setaria digitata TaxID=48799 RepID=A0A915Q7M3_9BILA
MSSVVLLQAVMEQLIVLELELELEPELAVHSRKFVDRNRKFEG